MIVGWIITAVAALLKAFFALLPSWAMPSWLASGTALPGSVASSLGGALEPVRAAGLPVDTILTVIGSIFSLWPLVIGYLVFEWVWKHVPSIAGFGTGDG